MNGWDITSLIIIILSVLLIVSYIIYQKKQKSDLVNKTPIIYGNLDLSAERDSICYRVANIGNLPGVAKALPQEVKLFGMAGEVDITVEKTPGRDYFDVIAPDAIKVNHRIVVGYVGSVKYQAFQVSIDGGDTKYPLVFVDAEEIGYKVNEKIGGDQ